MKSFKDIMAKVASPARETPPPTAGVSDDLDRDFVSWMEKKAGEDVVKTASCDHKKLKPGARCEKCGEMEKAAAPSIQAVRKALSMAKDNKAGLEEAVQNFAGREKLKSLLKGTALGGAATAGAGALYVKGRRDQRAKTASAIPVPAAKRVIPSVLDITHPHGMMMAAAASTPALAGRKKTAGVAENPENLELMAKIRARFAAGQPLGGDV